MPRRGPEPALKPARGRFIFLLLLAGAAPAAAQDEPPLLFRELTTVTGAASAKVTRTAGRTATLAGGSFSLRVSRHLAVGGSGYDLLGTVPIELADEVRDLSFGYGGLLIEFHPSAATAGPSLRLLAGAGNADLYRRATGARLHSANFLVVEPQGAYDLALRRRLAVQVAGGWRRVLGVRGLTPLGDGDLSGATLTASLRAGPF